MSALALMIPAKNLHSNRQKLLEGALKETEDRFKTLLESYKCVFENAVEGIFQSSPSGKILNANPALARIFGYNSSQEMVGVINDIATQIYVDPNRRNKFMKLLQKNGFVTDFESQVFRKDGKVIWILENARAVYNDRGELLCFVGTVEDVTEKRLAEEERAQLIIEQTARAEAEKTVKILRQLEKQKDDFLAIASHELKTPVTSIKAFTQILQRKIASYEDKEAVYYLSRISMQLDRLTKLIGELLDVTKIEADKLVMNKDNFDIDLLIDETIEDLKRTSQKHEIIKQGLVGDKVKADRERMNQVLTNLISNAIKYSPNGGEVIIKVAKIDSGIKISVQDFGIGISKENLTRVFERFFRGAGHKGETYPGLGLGLYISAQIIARHGGKIWVESPGVRKGSTFFFTLPFER